MTRKVWLPDKYGSVPPYVVDTNFLVNEDSRTIGKLYGWLSEERAPKQIVTRAARLCRLSALSLNAYR